ncbi:DUF4407 domain-containing protein [Petropleomorpha daqingensis]|uniref:DUF4407 domain-containing protein n=1 Tax=Petropleomorpha daqingensis TaxID=2026353 RepID=A0A853CCR2_9ACTN|nr:DUF4407 domain-containing protein [Petropleomorpha daqingensis]NYJ03943.1 hypothetical protein [Petropleomorpha daqingensis]
MARRRGRIGNALAVLAGARADILQVAPGSRAKFVALGGVLLSTGGLAVLSAAFAVHMAVGAVWPVAILIGLFWGLVIVNLDRMLLVGMAHDSSTKRNLLMAVPRVGLALVLGIVISTPLTLQIFHKEIDTEIVALQAEQSDAYKKSLDSDARFAGLPDLRDRVAAEQAIVASGGDGDTTLLPLTGAMTAAQTAYDQALATQQDLQNKAQCELNGTCGTGEPGTGEAYVQARAAADAQAAVVASAKSDLDAATAALSSGQARSASQAASSLETDQAELARLTADQTRLQQAFDATNADNTGILIRLQALGRLSDTNSTLGFAHFMLSLLFICIELLPVFMKTLLNFSPATAYDKLAEIRDDGDISVETMQQQTRREVERAQQELLILAEKERVDRQKEAVLARRRARLQLAAERQVVPADLQAEDDEPIRKPWDTGPIFEVAKNVVRSLRPRAGDRVDAAS